jgi:signal transduction histidine kinase/CheY-like chemotaxis protein
MALAMHRTFRFISLTVVLLLVSRWGPAWGNGEPKNVLYLNSYSITYSWSDSVTAAIRRNFYPREDIQLYIEHLDAKRFGNIHFEDQFNFLKKKYAGMKIHLVIASDNDALEFSLRYGDDLFPEVPVLFCGVNNPQDYSLEGTRFYGIREAVDQDSVNQLILKIMPGVKKLYFFNDSTGTSLINLRYIRQLEPRYRDRVEFVYFGNPGQDSLLKLVRTLERGNAIALIDIFQDSRKRPINPDFLVQQMAKVSPVPIFMDSDPSFGKGIAGGIINRGSEHGGDIARLAMMFLDNPGHKPLQRVSPPRDHYYFDYNVLKKYHIDISQLPEGSTVINEPRKEVVQYLKLIGGLLLLILILLSVISVLVLNNRKRKNAEALVKLKLAEIEEKNTILEKAHRSITSLLNEMEIKNKNLSDLNRELDKARLSAEESDKLKTTFLLNMSHEIRTPMNAIVGFSSLLRDEKSFQKQDEFIRIIETNCRSLLVLINDILDLSRMQSSQIALLPGPCALTDLIEKLYRSFLPECRQKHIEFKINLYSIPSDFLLIADEVRVEQVFSNLLSNAIKFTSSGTIEIGAQVGKDMITFYVKDSGIGIPKETGSRVFERFYKIEDPNTRIFRGAGLGLAICRSLVNLWNGKIWYESKAGLGSTFYFTHPLSGKYQTVERKVEYESDSVPDLTGKCLLIAEDEDSNYKLLATYLDETGARILRAHNGAEAVRIAHGNAVDLVLMDIKMPEMNGTEALRLIRKQFPALPVIAQTAYAFHEEVMELLQNGFNACITKPIRKVELFRLLHTQLRIKTEE